MELERVNNRLTWVISKKAYLPSLRFQNISSKQDVKENEDLELDLPEDPCEWVPGKPQNRAKSSRATEEPSNKGGEDSDDDIAVVAVVEKEASATKNGGDRAEGRRNGEKCASEDGGGSPSGEGNGIVDCSEDNDVTVLAVINKAGEPDVHRRCRNGGKYSLGDIRRKIGDLTVESVVDKLLKEFIHQFSLKNKGNRRWLAGNKEGSSLEIDKKAVIGEGAIESERPRQSVFYNEKERQAEECTVVDCTDLTDRLAAVDRSNRLGACAIVNKDRSHKDRIPSTPPNKTVREKEDKETSVVTDLSPVVMGQKGKNFTDLVDKSLPEQVENGIIQNEDYDITDGSPKGENLGSSSHTVRRTEILHVNQNKGGMVINRTSPMNNRSLVETANERNLSALVRGPHLKTGHPIQSKKTILNEVSTTIKEHKRIASETEESPSVISVENDRPELSVENNVCYKKQESEIKECSSVKVRSPFSTNKKERSCAGLVKRRGPEQTISTEKKDENRNTVSDTENVVQKTREPVVDNNEMCVKNDVHHKKGKTENSSITDLSPAVTVRKERNRIFMVKRRMKLANAIRNKKRNQIVIRDEPKNSVKYTGERLTGMSPLADRIEKSVGNDLSQGRDDSSSVKEKSPTVTVKKVRNRAFMVRRRRIKLANAMENKERNQTVTRDEPKDSVKYPGERLEGMSPLADRIEKSVGNDLGQGREDSSSVIEKSPTVTVKKVRNHAVMVRRRRIKLANATENKVRNQTVTGDEPKNSVKYTGERLEGMSPLANRTEISAGNDINGSSSLKGKSPTVTVRKVRNHTVMLRRHGIKLANVTKNKEQKQTATGDEPNNLVKVTGEGLEGMSPLTNRTEISVEIDIDDSTSFKEKSTTVTVEKGKNHIVLAKGQGSGPAIAFENEKGSQMKDSITVDECQSLTQEIGDAFDSISAVVNKTGMLGRNDVDSRDEQGEIEEHSSVKDQSIVVPADKGKNQAVSARTRRVETEEESGCISALIEKTGMLVGNDINLKEGEREVGEYSSIIDLHPVVTTKKGKPHMDMVERCSSKLANATDNQKESQVEGFTIEDELRNLTQKIVVERVDIPALMDKNGMLLGFDMDHMGRQGEIEERSPVNDESSDVPAMKESNRTVLVKRLDSEQVNISDGKKGNLTEDCITVSEPSQDSEEKQIDVSAVSGLLGVNDVDPKKVERDQNPVVTVQNVHTRPSLVKRLRSGIRTNRECRRQTGPDAAIKRIQLFTNCSVVLERLREIPPAVEDREEKHMDENDSGNKVEDTKLARGQKTLGNGSAVSIGGIETEFGAVETLVKVLKSSSFENKSTDREIAAETNLYGTDVDDGRGDVEAIEKSSQQKTTVDTPTIELDRPESVSDKSVALNVEYEQRITGELNEAKACEIAEDVIRPVVEDIGMSPNENEVERESENTNATEERTFETSIVKEAMKDGGMENANYLKEAEDSGTDKGFTPALEREKVVMDVEVLNHIVEKKDDGKTEYRDKTDEITVGEYVPLTETEKMSAEDQVLKETEVQIEKENEYSDEAKEERTDEEGTLGRNKEQLIVEDKVRKHIIDKEPRDMEEENSGRKVVEPTNDGEIAKQTLVEESIADGERQKQIVSDESVEKAGGEIEKHLVGEEDKEKPEDTNEMSNRRTVERSTPNRKSEEDEAAKIPKVVEDEITKVPKVVDEVTKVPQIVADEVVICEVQLENSSMKIPEATSDMKDKRTVLESAPDKKKRPFIGDEDVKRAGELIGKEDVKESLNTKQRKDKIMGAESAPDMKMDVKNKIEMCLVTKEKGEIEKTKQLKYKRMAGKSSPEQRKERCMVKDEVQNTEGQNENEGKKCPNKTKGKRNVVVRTPEKKREKHMKNKGAEVMKELSEKSVLQKEGECKTVKKSQREIKEFFMEKQIVKEGIAKEPFKTSAGGREMGSIKRDVKVWCTVNHQGQISSGVEPDEGRFKKTVVQKEVRGKFKSLRDENEQTRSTKIASKEKNEQLQGKDSLQIKVEKETDESAAEKTSSRPKFRVRKRLRNDDKGVRKIKKVMTEEMRRRKFEKYLAEKKRVGLFNKYITEKTASEASISDKTEKGLSEKMVKKEEPQIKKSPGEKSVENKKKVRGKFEKHRSGMEREQMEMLKDEIEKSKCIIKKKVAKKSKKKGEGERQTKEIRENKDQKQIKHTAKSKRKIIKQGIVNEKVRPFGDQADKNTKEKVNEISVEGVMKMLVGSQENTFTSESKKEVQIKTSARRPVGTEAAEEDIVRAVRSTSDAQREVQATTESKNKRPKEQKKSKVKTAVNAIIPVGQDVILKGVQNHTEACVLAAKNKILNDVSLVTRESNLKGDAEIIIQSDEKAHDRVVEDRQVLDSEIEKCTLVEDETSVNRECVLVKEADECDKVMEVEEQQINQYTIVQKSINQESKKTELSPAVTKAEIPSQEQKLRVNVTAMIEGASEIEKEEERQKEESTEVVKLIQNSELLSRNRESTIVTKEKAEVQTCIHQSTCVKEGDGEKEKCELLREEIINEKHLTVSREVQVMEEKGETDIERAHEVFRTENEGLSEAAGMSDVHIGPTLREECAVQQEGSGQRANWCVIEGSVDAEDQWQAEESKIIEDEECGTKSKPLEDVMESVVVEERQNEEPEFTKKTQENEKQFEERNKPEGIVEESARVEEGQNVEVEIKEKVLEEIGEGVVIKETDSKDEVVEDKEKVLEEIGEGVLIKETDSKDKVLEDIEKVLEEIGEGVVIKETDSKDEVLEDNEKVLEEIGGVVIKETDSKDKVLEDKEKVLEEIGEGVVIKETDSKDKVLEDVENCAMLTEGEKQHRDSEVGKKAQENVELVKEGDKENESGFINKMQLEVECAVFEEEEKQNEDCDVGVYTESSVMVKGNEVEIEECGVRLEVLICATAKEGENKDRATEGSALDDDEESTMDKEEYDFRIGRKAEGEFDEGEVVTGREKQNEDARTENKTEESIKSKAEENSSMEHVLENYKIGDLTVENKSQVQFESTGVTELFVNIVRDTNVESESLICPDAGEEEINKVCDSSLDTKDDEENEYTVESQQEVNIRDYAPDGNLSIQVESMCVSDNKFEMPSEVCRSDSDVECRTITSDSENQISICAIETEGEGDIDLCTIESIRKFIESTVEGGAMAHTGHGIVNNLVESCGSICSVDRSGKRQLCVCGIENEGQVCSFETEGVNLGDYVIGNGDENFTSSSAVKENANGQILLCSVGGDEPRVLKEHTVEGNINIPAVVAETHVGQCLADIEVERHVKVCTIENESERHIGDCKVENGLDQGIRCCTAEINRSIEAGKTADVNREFGVSPILYDQDGGIIPLIQNAGPVQTNVTGSCSETGEPVVQVHIPEDGEQKGESDFESEVEQEPENELEEEVLESVEDLGETIIEEFVDKDTWENQIVIMMEGVEAVQVATPDAEPGVLSATDAVISNRKSVTVCADHSYSTLKLLRRKLEQPTNSVRKSLKINKQNPTERKVKNAKKQKGKPSSGVRKSKPSKALQNQETPKRGRGRPKKMMCVEPESEGLVNQVQQSANGMPKKARVVRRRKNEKNDRNMLEGYLGAQQNSNAGSDAKKIVLMEDKSIFRPLGLVTKAMRKQMPDGFQMDMPPVDVERKFEGKWKKAMISKVMNKEAQLAAAEIEKALGNDPMERSGIKKAVRRRSRSQGNRASAPNVDDREPVYTEHVWREALGSPLIIPGLKETTKRLLEDPSDVNVSKRKLITKAMRKEISLDRSLFPVALENDAVERNALKKGDRRSLSQGNVDGREPVYTEHLWQEALQSPMIIPGLKEVRSGLSEDSMNKTRLSPTKLAYETNFKKNGDSSIFPKQKMIRRPKKAITPLPSKRMFKRFKEIPQNIKADFKRQLLGSVMLLKRIVVTRKDLATGVLQSGKPLIMGGTQILSIMTDSEEEDTVPKELDKIDGTGANSALTQADRSHVTTSPPKVVKDGSKENDYKKKDVGNILPVNCKPRFKKPRVARAPKKLNKEQKVIVEAASCPMPDLSFTSVEYEIVTDGLPPESDAQNMMVAENLSSVGQSELEETSLRELSDSREDEVTEVPPKHQATANGLLQSSSKELRIQDEASENNTFNTASENKFPSTLETKEIPNGEVNMNGSLDPAVPLVENKDQYDKPQEKNIKQKKKRIKVAEGSGSGKNSDDLALKQEEKKNAMTFDKVEESNGADIGKSARPSVEAPAKKVLSTSLKENNAVEVTSPKKPEEDPKGKGSPPKPLGSSLTGSLQQKDMTCHLANDTGNGSSADKLSVNKTPRLLDCSILPLKQINSELVSALPSLEELMGSSTTTLSPSKDEAEKDGDKKEGGKPRPTLPLKKKISREILSKATTVEDDAAVAEQKKIIEKLIGSDPKKKPSRGDLLLIDMFTNSVGKVSEKEKAATGKPVVKKMRISPVVSSQTKTPPDRSTESAAKKIKAQGLILIDLFKKEKEKNLLKKLDKKDVVNGKASPKEGLKSPVTSPQHKVVKDSSNTEKVAKSAEMKTVPVSDKLNSSTGSVNDTLKRKHSQEEVEEGHNAKKLKTESKENTASSEPNFSVESNKSDGKKQAGKERRKSIHNIPVEGEEGRDAKKLKPESKENTASSDLPNPSVDSKKSDGKKLAGKERRKSDSKTVQNTSAGMKAGSLDKKTEKITPVLDGSCPAQDEKLPLRSNETEASGSAEIMNGEVSDNIANGLQTPEVVMKLSTSLVNDVNDSLPLQRIFKLRDCFVLLHRLPEDIVNSVRPFRRKIKKRKKIITQADVPSAEDQPSTSGNSAVLERLSPSTSVSPPVPAEEEQHSCPQSPSKKQLHVCEVCGERFLAFSILLAHRKKHSLGELSSPDKSKVLQDSPKPSVRKKASHLCPFCLKKFKGKKCFIQHLKQHPDAKQCKCYSCNKTFLTYYDLFVHMRIHTKEHPYPCYICQKTFGHPTTLQTHIEKNHLKKQFKCFSCEKSFLSVVNRSAHMKKHHENEPE